MHLSDLQTKDIVSLNGTNIGRIIDVIIDENGNMKSLIVQKTKFGNFFHSNEVEINWEQIKKIGDDVILVNL